MVGFLGCVSPSLPPLDALPAFGRYCHHSTGAPDFCSLLGINEWEPTAAPALAPLSAVFSENCPVAKATIKSVPPRASGKLTGSPERPRADTATGNEPVRPSPASSTVGLGGFSQYPDAVCTAWIGSICEACRWLSVKRFTKNGNSQ